MDITEVQPGEPLSFIGVTYYMGDMLYNRSKNDSVIAESPKPRTWSLLHSLPAVGGWPFLMAQF